MGGCRFRCSAVSAWVIEFRCGLVLASVLLAMGSAYADQHTINYTTRVDVSDLSAEVARQKAMRQGANGAATELLRLLVLEDDWSELPKLSDKQVDALIYGFEFKNEKTSSVRFIADLTVLFSTTRVRKFLGERGVRYSEARDKPILVLPVLWDGTRPILWNKLNPWFEAWTELRLGERLAPLLVPRGDLDDMQEIGDDPAQLIHDVTRLLVIARRYGAERVLVLEATPRGEGNIADSVTVTGHIYGSADSGPIVSSQFNAQDEITIPDMMAYIARDISRNIEEEWKRGHLVRLGSERRLAIRVVFKGIQDWVEIQKKLRGLEIVRQIEIVAMRVHEMNIQVNFAATVQDLQTSLAAQGVLLVPDDSGQIVMYLGQATGALPPLPNLPGDEEATSPESAIVRSPSGLLPFAPTARQAQPAPFAGGGAQDSPRQEDGGAALPTFGRR